MIIHLWLNFALWSHPVAHYYQTTIQRIYPLYLTQIHCILLLSTVFYSYMFFFIPIHCFTPIHRILLQYPVFYSYPLYFFLIHCTILHSTTLYHNAIHSTRVTGRSGGIWKSLRMNTQPNKQPPKNRAIQILFSWTGSSDEIWSLLIIKLCLRYKTIFNISGKGRVKQKRRKVWPLPH